MICENCGQLEDDCECEIDMEDEDWARQVTGDDARDYGYDGDCY